MRSSLLFFLCVALVFIAAACGDAGSNSADDASGNGGDAGQLGDGATGTDGSGSARGAAQAADDALDASMPIGPVPYTPYACTTGQLSPTSAKGVLLTCSMMHQEYSPSAPIQRNFGVFIPNGYVPGSSGAIFKILGTTHGITSDCGNVPAVSELSGWDPFLQTVGTNAPVLICPEGLFDTGGTDNGEREDTWGFHGWNYAIAGAKPNDLDLFARIITDVQTDLQLDPKVMAVTNDWYPVSAIQAHEFAAKYPAIVSSLVLYNDALFYSNTTRSPVTGTVTGGMFDHDQGAAIPILPPTGAMNILMVVSMTSSGGGSMCGGQYKPYTVDDTYAYWAQVNKPDSVTYSDPTNANTKFCSLTGGPNAPTQGTATTLEMLVAKNSATGKEIKIVKLVGNARGTPICSANLQGNSDPTICASTNPPVNLMFPPADGTYLHPGNHYLSPPDNYLLPLMYRFVVDPKHRLP